jgi:hypothetical protein
VAQGGPIPGPAVRNTPPDANDYGLVVRVVGSGGVGVIVDQGTSPWIVSDPPLEAAIDVLLSTRASEATLAALSAFVALRLDVALSTRASEATLVAVEADTSAISANIDVALSTRASEATLATRASEATLATRASEATLLTRASEATLVAVEADTSAISANIDVALSTRASDATLATRASEATLATRASEATLVAVEADTTAISANIDVALSTRASEATLATRLADATFTARINTLGQKLMAASTPVVIASDQSAIPISAAALPLPAGAATEATLATRLADATFTARINTLGQKLMAASTPVVIASDQSTIPISAAALPLPAGAATEATLATRLADATFTARINTLGQKLMAASTPVVIASDQSAVPVSSTQLPAALVGGRLDENVGAWLGSTAPTVGQKVMANSVPVVIASDQSTVSVTLASGTSTGTLNNGAETAVGAAAVQIIAANANRKSLIIQNTGLTNMRVGAAGVTTTTGVRLASGDTLILELPVATNAIFAIRETTDTTALTQEIT